MTRERNQPERSGVYVSMSLTTAVPSAGFQPGATDPPPPAADPVVVDTHVPDFADFYRRHWPPVARALTFTTGDPELGAEATDEAMARAYANWSKISRYDNPAGWVYRVGLNWSRSLHRRLSRALPARPARTVPEVQVPDPAIRAALLDLDHRHRSVVVCRLLLDWSTDETAEALGIRPGTVKSRLSRALTILQSSLSHLGDPS